MGLQVCLFQPKTFRYYKVRPVRHPEISARVRRLWLAVLQRSLQDYALYCDATDPEGLQELAEVRSWLYSDGEDYVGSFRSICGILDIDAARVLRHLDNVSEEGLRGLRKSGWGDVQ